MKKEKEFLMKNSSSVASSGFWYPLTESGAPNRLNLEQDTPFTSAVFTNNSGEKYLIRLDPTGHDEGPLEWEVPDGYTWTLKAEEKINFYQVVCKNLSGLASDIGELKLQVRNY